MQSLKMQVYEAKMEKDVGRNIVRINAEAMNSLSLTVGDPVHISGSDVTVATAMPAYPEESDLTNFIRMNKFIRNNCGVELTNSVNVEKAQWTYAERVELAPVDIRISSDKEFVDFARDKMKDVCVLEGKIFPLRVLNHVVPFRVTKTTPEGIVKICPTTIIKVLPNPIPVKRKLTVRRLEVSDGDTFEVSEDEKILTSLRYNDKLALWLVKEAD